MTGCTDGIHPWCMAYFDQGLVSCKLKCYCGRIIRMEGWDRRLKSKGIANTGLLADLCRCGTSKQDLTRSC